MMTIAFVLSGVWPWLVALSNLQPWAQNAFLPEAEVGFLRQVESASKTAPAAQVYLGDYDNKLANVNGRHVSSGVLNGNIYRTVSMISSSLGNEQEAAPSPTPVVFDGDADEEPEDDVRADVEVADDVTS